MNFTSKKVDNLFLKMIFRYIDNALWNKFELKVSFNGREISPEIGGGIEARDFKVELVEKGSIPYLSPRDKMLKRFDRNDERTNENRSKGGLKSSRVREAKRRLDALRKEKMLQTVEEL